MYYHDPAFLVKKCPAYWNILRAKETEWYERHFLVKYLKYALKLNKGQILSLLDGIPLLKRL